MIGRGNSDNLAPSETEIASSRNVVTTIEGRMEILWLRVQEDLDGFEDLRVKTNLQLTLAEHAILLSYLYDLPKVVNTAQSILSECQRIADNAALDAQVFQQQEQQPKK